MDSAVRAGVGVGVGSGKVRPFVRRGMRKILSLDGDGVNGFVGRGSLRLMSG